MAGRPKEYGEYEVIDGTWQFDLDFYRAIGLDLSELEDGSEGAAMPLMRSAASHVIEATKPAAKDRAIAHLESARSALFDLMLKARRNISFDGITSYHPEVLAWQERDAQKERPDPRPITYLLGDIDCIALGLVRPRMDDIDGSEDSKYRWFPLSRPDGALAGLEGVANQLVQAHVAVTWDI